jgi:hypothetical protein
MSLTYYPELTICSKNSGPAALVGHAVAQLLEGQSHKPNITGSIPDGVIGFVS